MRDSLPELLALARSASWEARCRVATGLPRLQSRDAAATMRSLLRDEDTAVVQEAGLALLARQDSYGADLVFDAVATADEEIADHLIHFIQGEWSSLETAGFRELAESRLIAGEGQVPEGAFEVLEALGWAPPCMGHEDDPLSAPPEY